MVLCFFSGVTTGAHTKSYMNAKPRSKCKDLIKTLTYLSQHLDSRNPRKHTFPSLAISFKKIPKKN